MMKLFIILGGSIIVLISGFFAFNSYIYNQKQSENSEEIKPYNGSFSGEYTCLPHTDQSGPQRLECALGLKTDTGEYYALDFSQAASSQQDLKTGERITLTGKVTPVEMLSTDHWRKYSIKGIVSLTEPVKKN